MKRADLEKAFLKAYDEYGDAIYRFCYFKTSDSELALDLTQEVFSKTWMSIQNGTTIKNMRPFLYKIATNLVIDWYRKKKSESLDELMEAGYEPSDQSGQSAEVDAELGLALSRLKKLEAMDRDLITMRYVDGLSPSEIAEVTNEKENTVSVRLHRALGRLREVLNDN